MPCYLLLDKVADYNCECTDNFGGKNCSVPLTGCDEVKCLNAGTCTPWLVGEDDHRANCSCMPGFDGEICETVTTFSFKGNSYVSVESDQEEFYELSFRFRTTLANGLLAIGQGSTFFTLQLEDGKLRLHSSMLREFSGVTIGQNLSNTEWQKVTMTIKEINILTINLNDRLQQRNEINPDNSSQTAFQSTNLGGIPIQSKSRVLVRPNSEFIGKNPHCSDVRCVHVIFFRLHTRHHCEWYQGDGEDREHRGDRAGEHGEGLHPH